MYRQMHKSPDTKKGNEINRAEQEEEEEFVAADLLRANDRCRHCPSFRRRSR